MTDLLLGLIGDNIAASSAPRLHRLAGGLCGIDVRYERLVPAALELDFDGVFAKAQTEGYHGLNITYPYKERVTEKLEIEEAGVRAMGAVNTVLFEAGGPKGYNTDYSGFVAAYRAGFGEVAPGPVCMVGAGGVGKAVAFGLLACGLTDLRIVERDQGRAETLAASLRSAAPELRLSLHDGEALAQAADGAEGFVNCTPVGMVGYEGTPVRPELLAGGRWAFDAVYTPLDTQFLGDAAAAGLTVITGYELFFHQGVDAFRLFSGRELDAGALREALAANDA